MTVQDVRYKTLKALTKGISYFSRLHKPGPRSLSAAEATAAPSRESSPGVFLPAPSFPSGRSPQAPPGPDATRDNRNLIQPAPAGAPTSGDEGPQPVEVAARRPRGQRGSGPRRRRGSHGAGLGPGRRRRFPQAAPGRSSALPSPNRTTAGAAGPRAGAC